MNRIECFLVRRAEQALAADGAIAWFSSNFFHVSLNADRAPQLKAVVRLLLSLMALDVFWEEEDGDTIERCPVWYKPGEYVTDVREFENTLCLKFIDD